MSGYHPFVHFGILEKLHFSGRLIQADPISQERIIYFSQGKILYATGGTHPVRRLRRQLTVHCPWLISNRERWEFYLNSIDISAFPAIWEYALLNFWVTNQEITLEQASRMIRAIVMEVLFEIAQSVAVNERTQHDRWPLPELQVISVEAAVTEAQQQWQAWQNIWQSADQNADRNPDQDVRQDTGQSIGQSIGQNIGQSIGQNIGSGNQKSLKFTHAAPTDAPVVRQVEQLRRYSSAQMFHTLLRHLNGQHTLYHLAWQTQQNVVAVAASLKPFIQRGWIDLIQIPDLPPPHRNIARNHPAPPSSHPLRVPTKLVAAPASRDALIACIDDSSLVRLMLEKLLVAAGYRFIGVADAQRAIGVLLAHKPDFIFLDLVMPNTNGYEVCEQLRQISQFQHTPIVMLTGYDGFTSRMRSNFVGASDFLSKPLEAEAVLSVVQKHLEKLPLSRTTEISPLKGI